MTHPEKWNDKQLMTKTSTTAANTSGKKPSMQREFSHGAPKDHNMSHVSNNNSKRIGKFSSVGAGIIHGGNQFLNIYNKPVINFDPNRKRGMSRNRKKKVAATVDFMNKRHSVNDESTNIQVNLPTDNDHP